MRAWTHGAPASAPTYTGPGDVVSGAVAFWSCTFAYNNAFAAGGGNMCLLVDAATGLTSYTLTALSTGKANFAGAAASSACAVACVVKVVYDQVNSNHVCGGNVAGNVCPGGSFTLADMPAYTFNSIGTLATMTAAGGSAVEIRGTWASGAEVQPIAITIEAQLASTAASSGYFGWESTGGYIATTTGGGGVYQLNAGFSLNSSVNTDTSLHAIQAVANGVSSSLTIDTSTASGNAGTRGFAIGEQIDLMIQFTGGTTMNGALGEVAVYPSGVTYGSTQISAMYTNMSGRY